MKTYYREYDVTASITDNKDGSATLKIAVIGGKKTTKKYKNRKSAYSAWRRYCS